ncbi:MAG: hypothetical protein R3Y09_11910 [Clostridia bacterium]
MHPCVPCVKINMAKDMTLPYYCPRFQEKCKVFLDIENSKERISINSDFIDEKYLNKIKLFIEQMENEPSMKFQRYY